MALVVFWYKTSKFSSKEKEFIRGAFRNSRGQDFKIVDADGKYITCRKDLQAEMDEIEKRQCE